MVIVLFRLVIHFLMHCDCSGTLCGAHTMHAYHIFNYWSRKLQLHAQIMGGMRMEHTGAVLTHQTFPSLLGLSLPCCVCSAKTKDYVPSLSVSA